MGVHALYAAAFAVTLAGFAVVCVTRAAAGCRPHCVMTAIMVMGAVLVTLANALRHEWALTWTGLAVLAYCGNGGLPSAA